MDNQNIPIDPKNPLGYTSVTPPYDHASRPCLDFHHSLGWIFWQSYVAKEQGGSFEHVRLLRHLILSALENRGCAVQKVQTPNFEYDVEVALVSGFIGILVSRTHITDSEQDCTYCHVLSKTVINDQAIQDALSLNKELLEIVTVSLYPVSPFGPADIVMPGNFNYEASKSMFGRQPQQFVDVVGPTRNVRLFPEFSKVYEDSVADLYKAPNIFHIQMMLGRHQLIDMPASEFNRFIHLVAARAHKLTQDQI